jgi:hypothetical protein
MKFRMILVSVLAVLSISGCSESTSPIDAAALLESRCGVCHTTDFPKNARKSKSDWEETVTRMMAKGAKLSPEEKKSLVRYLAKHYRP